MGQIDGSCTGPADCQRPPGEVLEVVEVGDRGGVDVVGKSGRQERLGELCHLGDADRLAVQESPAAGGGGEGLAVDGILDHADNEGPVHLEGDRDGKDGNSVGVVGRPVERIDYPAPWALEMLRRGLFGEQPIVAECALEGLEDEPLRGGVHLRDEVDCPLVGGADGLAEVLHEKPAGGLGGLDGHRELALIWHGVLRSGLRGGTTGGILAEAAGRRKATASSGLPAGVADGRLNGRRALGGRWRGRGPGGLPASAGGERQAEGGGNEDSLHNGSLQLKALGDGPKTPWQRLWARRSRFLGPWPQSRC